jgi:hypothetical protein
MLRARVDKVMHGKAMCALGWLAASTACHARSPASQAQPSSASYSPTPAREVPAAGPTSAAADTPAEGGQAASAPATASSATDETPMQAGRGQKPTGFDATVRRILAELARPPPRWLCWREQQAGRTSDGGAVLELVFLGGRCLGSKEPGCPCRHTLDGPSPYGETCWEQRPYLYYVGGICWPGDSLCPCTEALPWAEPHR